MRIPAGWNQDRADFLKALTAKKIEIKKSWKTYPTLSKKKKIAHWAKNMSFVMEIFGKIPELGTYSVFTKEWYKRAKIFEPQFELLLPEIAREIGKGKFSIRKFKKAIKK